MEIIQILATAGAISVLALVIGLFIISRIKAPTTTQLPTSEAITKDVLDQTSKPKKKRKYYPKKPKTQL